MSKKKQKKTKVGKGRKVFLCLALILIAAQLVYYFQFNQNRSLDTNESIEAAASLSRYEKSLMKLEVALEQFVDDNEGEPPGLLVQLMPNYIKEIPNNPATSAPFEYKVVNGVPVLEGSRRYGGKESEKVKGWRKKISDLPKFYMPQW